MSHFVVVVAVDGSVELGDVEARVSDAMQPFHEFECTGENDQYVVNVDKTAEAREEYESTTRRMIRAPNGRLADAYNDEFYREMTPAESADIGPIAGSGCNSKFSWTSKNWGDGRGYRTKIRYVPDGSEEVVVPVSAVESFADWAHGYYGTPILKPGENPDLDGAHKYGWILVDGRGDVTHVIDRTNPNKKWDWWVIGGRWAGFFRSKSKALSARGTNGLMGSEKSSGGADVIRKHDVDYASEAASVGAEAGALYDKVYRVAGEHIGSYRAWSVVCEQITDIDQARSEYNAQAAVAALREAARADRALSWLNLEDFVCTREAYVAKRIQSARTPFALLDKSGLWHERGRMGWWATVSDENHDWPADFERELAKVGDNDWLVAVDCHI